MPWVTILQVAAIAALWLVLLLAAAFLAGRFFSVERYPDEVHYARTADGWRVAVTRYRAAGAAKGPPVVLVPGIATNSLCFDLSDETSLARALAAAGRDTWVVELRGRGLSSQPRLFSRFDYDWSFDEYVEQDVPAALAVIERATGADQFDLVGFSLGGMVAYAVAAAPAWQERVRALVTLGAPASFRFQGRYLFTWPLRNLRFLRHRFLMRLFAPLAGYWTTSPVRLLHNAENMPGETLRRFMVNASASFARNELLQLGDWIEHDAFRSIDHRRDYRAGMREIRARTLFVAGNKDLLAPMNAVKDAHDACGAADKKLVITSHAAGFTASYGHLDLVLGTKARAEVFPVVVEWLDRTAGSGPAGSGS